MIIQLTKEYTNKLRIELYGVRRNGWLQDLTHELSVAEKLYDELVEAHKNNKEDYEVIKQTETEFINALVDAAELGSSQSRQKDITNQTIKR